MTNWFERPGLRPQAVVANDDEMAIGAIQALKQAKSCFLAKRSSRGIDATPDGLAAMKAGDSQGDRISETPLLKAPEARRYCAEARQGVRSVASFGGWVPFELVTPEKSDQLPGQALIGHEPGHRRAGWLPPGSQQRPARRSPGVVGPG